MLRRTPLKPGGSLTRTGPLSRRSPGLCATKRAQRKAYKEAAETEDPWCVCCGRPGSTDHSHLFPQGRFPQHRNNPLNWLKKCRACHRLFEDNKAAFAVRFPAVWVDILRRMQLIDAAAFAEFEMKYSTLIPTP